MKTVTLLLAICFVLIPFANAQDDDLDSVISAYERYAEWTSYAAQTSVRVQLAYSLNTEDESFSRAESVLRGFDALYDVGTSSVSGEFTEQRTQRMVSDDDAPRSSEIAATLDVVGIDDTVYASGTADLGTERISTEEFEEIGDNFAVLNLAEVADYSEFRNIDSIITLLQETGSVLSTEVTTTRQYDGELIVYEIEADAEQAIEALDLDLEVQFEQLLEQDAVDDEALLEAMADNADMTMAVFLDAETGALVAENIILLINIEWEDDQITDGSLFIEYSYDYLVLYDAVNQPVEILLP